MCTWCTQLLWTTCVYVYIVLASWHFTFRSTFSVLYRVQFLFLHPAIVSNFLAWLAIHVTIVFMPFTLAPSSPSFIYYKLYSSCHAIFYIVFVFIISVFTTTFFCFVYFLPFFCVFCSWKVSTSTGKSTAHNRFNIIQSVMAIKVTSIRAGREQKKPDENTKNKTKENQHTKYGLTFIQCATLTLV